jgi:hypothetical protein
MYINIKAFLCLGTNILKKINLPIINEAARATLVLLQEQSILSETFL